MKVVISGGTGLVGAALARRLLARGDDVVILSRNPATVSLGRGVGWDSRAGGAWEEEVATADAVVNLAGATISQRWTRSYKHTLRESRLAATDAIVRALSKAPHPGRVLVSASAVGYYGSRGDEELTEASPPGDGFLPELAIAWESAARRADEAARVVVLRLGVVLAAEGGALPQIALPFRFFVGGRVGSGRQWMSWIHIDDVVGMIVWAIDTEAVRGVFNATAPQPVTNAELTRAVAAALSRPALFPVPGFVLRLLFGEMATALLLTGQKVLPERARESGFTFRFERAEEAIAAVLRPGHAPVDGP